MVAWNFGFRIWRLETYPGPRRPVPGACRILCSNVRGLSKNLSDLTLASSLHDLLLCSETLVSEGVIYQSFWFLDLVVLSCCARMECGGSATLT